MRRGRAGRGRAGRAGSSQIRYCGESTLPNATNAQTHGGRVAEEASLGRRPAREREPERDERRTPGRPRSTRRAAPWPAMFCEPCESTTCGWPKRRQERARRASRSAAAATPGRNAATRGRAARRARRTAATTTAPRRRADRAGAQARAVAAPTRRARAARARAARASPRRPRRATPSRVRAGRDEQRRRAAVASSAGQRSKRERINEPTSSGASAT